MWSTSQSHVDCQSCGPGTRASELNRTSVRMSPSSPPTLTSCVACGKAESESNGAVRSVTQHHRDASLWATTCEFKLTPHLLRQKKKDLRVPRRSSAFDEKVDLDCWMFFHSLQRPYSPLKHTSDRYRMEAAEAEAAEAEDWRRGEWFEADHLKELVRQQMGFNHKSPIKTQSFDPPGSPMDCAW